MMMPNLLLQRTSIKCKTRINKDHLKRRLDLWDDGKIDDLISEAREIQLRLPSQSKKPKSVEDLSRTFASLMMQGKIQHALRLLQKEYNNGILPLNTNTMNELSNKHPYAQPKYAEMLLNGPIKRVSRVIYDQIDSVSIRKSAMKTKGSAGPLLLDADEWRRILGTTIFGSDAEDLRQSLAELTKILCTEEISDPDSLNPLLACRLIPLDKFSGLRPIGVGEVLRRILGKTVMSLLKPGVQESAGYTQLCPGHEGGCEVGVHAMMYIFGDDATEGVLQVDAENAFNWLNRAVMIHNVKILCPEISNYVYNSYCQPARLFVTGGKEIQSMEGTTQGDPIAMPIYGISIIPLLNSLKEISDEDMKQQAYADDLTGAGPITSLRKWWDNVVKVGPFLGYYPKASKSWLIVKLEYLEIANLLFEGTNFNITTEGRRHLGAVIGSGAYKEEYLSGNVNGWIEELNELTFD